MSLLNKLWDDTIAGPPPDKGLGKLRKPNLSFRSLNSEKETETGGTTGGAEHPATRVTRSIMIVKPERSLSETPPASPAGSTTPVSPFSGESFRFRRKSASDAFEKASGIGTRSPRPPYEL
ncbi:putative dormancy/auxin associated protein [Helianthus debilis subsp. tardiflorus]